MATPNIELKNLNAAAAAAGLSQGEFASLAGMHRSRWNLAIHGRADLNPQEIEAAREALRSVLGQRIEAFSRVLSGDLTACA